VVLPQPPLGKISIDPWTELPLPHKIKKTIPPKLNNKETTEKKDT
jgi:hypothetical protein